VGAVYRAQFLRCIHCEHVRRGRPTRSGTSSKMFEWSFTNAEDAIYTKAELLV